MLKRLRNFIFPDHQKRLAQRKFNQALKSIGKGSIAIDCGANIGDYSLKMAKTGATVYAFEPNPHAYGVLDKRAGTFSNAHIFQKAVGASSGTVSLHLHKEHNEDPVKWSVGSSMFPEKGNVSNENSIEVEQIDLVDFLKQLNSPIDLLKIDIEGAEVDLLLRLLEVGELENMKSVFVEMHDDKIPSLIDGSAKLRSEILSQGLTNIDLNWR